MAAFFEQTSESPDWSGAAGLTQTRATASAVSDDEGIEDTPARSAPPPARPAIPRHKRTALLTKVVEAEILPRLAMVRGAAAARVPGSAEAVTTKDDTAELVRLLLAPDTNGASVFIATLRQRGVTPYALYLGAVTDAARILGQMWDDDRCDFAEVTIGLGRLQQVVRTISPGFQAAAITHAHPETVLLVPAPGDQHTFGLLIVAEFFQREGWHVAGGPATTAEDAVAIVRDSWVDVAGFSIGSASRLDGLMNSIRTLRRASRNRDLSIMVGGPLLLRQPDLAARVGADIGAKDAVGAVRQASGLVALRTAAD